MEQLSVESCLLFQVEPGIQSGRQPVDLFRIVMEHCPDGVLVLDRRGTLVFANPAALTLFGRSIEQIVAYIFQSAGNANRSSGLQIFLPGREARVAEAQVRKIAIGDDVFYIVAVRDITEISRQLERLRTLSMLDELTGLYNRRGFFTFGEQRLEMADRLGKRLLLLFVDLDGLKSINDRFGHEEGDRTLVNVATIFKRTFRKSDIIARIGGDEFAILSMVSTLTSTDTLLARFATQVEAHNQSSDSLCTLSLSVGGAYYEPGSRSSLESLLSEADRLMYANKREGR